MLECKTQTNNVIEDFENNKKAALATKWQLDDKLQHYTAYKPCRDEIEVQVSYMPVWFRIHLQNNRRFSMSQLILPNDDSRESLLIGKLSKLGPQFANKPIFHRPL